MTQKDFLYTVLIVTSLMACSSKEPPKKYEAIVPEGWREYEIELPNDIGMLRMSLPDSLVYACAERDGSCCASCGSSALTFTSFKGYTTKWDLPTVLPSSYLMISLLNGWQEMNINAKDLQQFAYQIQNPTKGEENRDMSNDEFIFRDQYYLYVKNDFALTSESCFVASLKITAWDNCRSMCINSYIRLNREKWDLMAYSKFKNDFLASIDWRPSRFMKSGFWINESSYGKVQCLNCPTDSSNTPDIYYPSLARRVY